MCRVQTIHSSANCLVEIVNPTIELACHLKASDLAQLTDTFMRSYFRKLLSFLKVRNLPNYQQTSSVTMDSWVAEYQTVLSLIIAKASVLPHLTLNSHEAVKKHLERVNHDISLHNEDERKLTREDKQWLAELLVWELLCMSHHNDHKWRKLTC